MVKHKKKSKAIFITSFIVIAILIIGFFAISESVIGVSNRLEYLTDWRLNDLEKGVRVSEAILKLPEGTSQFAFTIDYGNEIESRREQGTCNVDVKYEIFNFNTNSYENIHQKSWSLKEYNNRASKLRFDGEAIYIKGIPDAISTIRTQDSSRSENRRWDKYISCLDGMSPAEAKTLFCTGRIGGQCSDSRYTFKCMTPDSTINEHSKYDDYEDDNDFYFFPSLNSYQANHIQDNKAKLRITINKKSNCQAMNKKDFGIDLFEVITPAIDTFTYSITTDSCKYKAKYTYQTGESDYFTRNECEYQNEIIECYKKEHCNQTEGLIAKCDEGLCEYRKETIIDRIFPGGDEPEAEDPQETEDQVDTSPTESEDITEPVKQKIKLSSFIIPLIILTLLILIIRNIARKRKK